MTINSCRAYFLTCTSMGDVNGNGEIDISDMTRFVIIILNGTENLTIKKVVTNITDAPITYGGMAE